MSNQLKLMPIYKCNVYDSQGDFIRTAWETYNKEYAEEFCKTYQNLRKDGDGRTYKVEEVIYDEVF